MLNDLPRKVKSTVKLYADDVLLYRAIHSKVDCEVLQKDLGILDQWAEDWQMSFNLSKCELIRISNKRYPLRHCYYIREEPITPVHHGKYLGVVIDERLSFNEHVEMIANKANAVKAFLQRNISSCPQMVKETCYKSMIRPILEYSSTVWSPYTNKNITLLESVQRRAARFVTNTYDRMSSVTSLLQELGWPSLYQRRKIAKAIMLYKILHNMVAIPIKHYKVPITVYTIGHPQRFQQVAAHINAYLYSYFPSSIKIWNSLPEAVIQAPDVEEFKKLIKAHYNCYISI